MTLDQQKQTAQNWFKQLRDEICASYEKIEDDLTGTYADREAGRFERKVWSKDKGRSADRPSPEPASLREQEASAGSLTQQNGGEMSVMKGRVFEKVGVNISTVEGEFSEQFRKEIPGAEDNPTYWASGISLVAHQHSPKAPAAHFNTRMIVVGDGARIWFGGGGDLNPMVEDKNDTADFHAAFKKACDAHNPAFHDAFKKWCDEYFFIPHRGFARGVGGIFYDYLGLNSLGKKTGSVESGRFGKGGVTDKHTKSGMELAAAVDMDWDQCFAYTQDVGRTFRDIYPELIRRHMNDSWTQEEREWQLQKRGYYAEYNLLYDRGTRFGLMTGGNTEAILMSLPPEAKWV